MTIVTMIWTTPLFLPSILLPEEKSLPFVLTSNSKQLDQCQPNQISLTRSGQSHSPHVTRESSPDFDWKLEQNIRTVHNSSGPEKLEGTFNFVATLICMNLKGQKLIGVISVDNGAERGHSQAQKHSGPPFN